MIGCVEAACSLDCSHFIKTAGETCMNPHRPVDRARRAGVFRLAALAALAVLGSASMLPAAAAFPDRPIHIVVPFSPGGGTDAITRMLSVGMAEALGQPVIVDNKPGAGTIIGSDFVAKSAPDGNTLVMATFAHAVNPALQPKLPYDTDAAFAPVALIGVSPNVLVVRAASPYKTLAELIAAAKATPGKLTFASQGNGTSAHLAGELFKNLAHAEITHVPYRAAGPALKDVIERLNAAARRAVETPAFLKQAESEGLAVDVQAPEQLSHYVSAQQARWRKLVQDNHITVD